MLLARRFLVVALPLVWIVAAPPLRAQVPAKKAEIIKPTADERKAITAAAIEVEKTLARKGVDGILKNRAQVDLLADVLVFRDAAMLMDELDEYADKGDAVMLLDLLKVSQARADSAAESKFPWTTESGSIVRGYRSKLDGSIQPYAVEVPPGFDFNKPARLDVVLHGRNDKQNEARFLKAHIGKKVPADRPGLTLHVNGRGNNAYRWAGETDVFEAIEAVKRNYKVDEDRVVLRGFSMGGAGAWHLGLHHPTHWASVEAGAGFTETMRYARIDDKTLPDWRRKALTIYDSADYALNAFDIPIAGYGGEDDPQLQASTNIVNALKALGVTLQVDGLVTRSEVPDFRRIVGKGMGHRVDPASAALLKTFHDDHAKTGINRTTKQIRFVTYTLAYNTAAWISVERLVEHYRRTTVEADLKGELATITTSNVAALAVDRQVAETVRIDGVELPLRLAAKGLLPKVYYRKGAEGWEVVDHDASIVMMDSLDGFKSPSVHGPIDDALRGPFLVVLPSGTPWNQAVHDWARRRAGRFLIDWRRSFRALPVDLMIVPDEKVTEEQIESHHLILFGDPGSNSVLAKVLKGLPVEWNKQKFKLGTEYDAAIHAPVLIAPNPLNPKRYVVVNSGMTFEPSDFKGTNALLFPRLGDYAVFKVGEKPSEALTSGYFNEHWRMGAP
jgi:Putative esterase